MCAQPLTPCSIMRFWGENIAVIGGGLVGLETAVDLTQRGKKVTVVEMAPKLLPEPVFMQNMMMIMGLVKRSDTFTGQYKAAENRT